MAQPQMSSSLMPWGKWTIEHRWVPHPPSLHSPRQVHRWTKVHTRRHHTLDLCIQLNLHITFVVLNSPSAYNVILGRPWIHEMRAFPSVFHQVIWFPTTWGVKEIRGEHVRHMIVIVTPLGPSLPHLIGTTVYPSWARRSQPARRRWAWWCLHSPQLSWS